MSEQVMQDPAPENIEGQKIVRHQFDHGIDWQVNVSHVLVAAAVVLVLAHLWRSDNFEGESQDDEGGPV